MKFKTYILFLVLFLFTLLVGIVTLLGTKHKDNTISSISTKPNNISIKTLNKNAFYPIIKHVFVIVEENHDWKFIYNNPEAPFINLRLLRQGAHATNYHNIPESIGVLHPSELNYILIEAGIINFPDHAFTTDDFPSAQNATSSQNHLVSLLEKNGYTWKSYQEDISGDNCPIDTIKDYAPKHNPFVYFQDVSGNPPSSRNRYCKDHVRPFSELRNDLATGNVANYVFITPNLKHDMHDGTIAQADTWLSQIVPVITTSSSFKNDGALFITWDEGSKENKEGKEIDGNNPIGMIIQSPFVRKNYSNTLVYSHLSLLKTIEETFNLTPLLGQAKDLQVQDLSDFFINNK